MASKLHKGHRSRVKKEFLENGFTDSTPEHKILELLLFFCLPQGDTNPLAHELLNRYGSISAVIDAPVEELVEFKGITESNVVLLKLIMPVARAYRLSEQKEGFKFLNPTEIGNYLLDRYLGETRECCGMVSFGKRSEFLGFDYIGKGDICSVQFSPRTMIETALKRGAIAVVLVHNHPTGSAIPSEADKIATAQIAKTLSQLGINLVDHIVICHDDYVSMAQSHEFDRFLKV